MGMKNNILPIAMALALTSRSYPIIKFEADDKETPIPNGIKKFTFQGTVIYAINEKNAKRKYAKLCKQNK